MFTEDQYYFRVDNDAKPVSLYRLRPPFLAEQWLEGKWQHSDRLLVWLRDGHVDLDRCSIEEAKAFKPEAFDIPDNDNSEGPFSYEEAAKAFAMATSVEPLPKRFKGILGESEMSDLAYKVKDVLTQENFSDQDSDLEIVMALFWQFYRLGHPGGAHYNSALVAEFYERKTKHLAAEAGPALNSNYALHELTLAELIKRAKRSIQLLEKYNLPMLTHEQQVDFQDHLIWPNAYELSRDEAAELLFVAFMEMEAFSDRRVEIHDIKRIIINCLELMKFRGIAMYKYACYSSKEEYDTTSEDDAEIFICAAHSEEEADEIVGAKHYWLSVLIGVQALEDQSPE
jgi:hypothetical protein